MSGHYEKAHLGPLLIVVLSLLAFQICISNAGAANLAWDPVTAEGSYPVAGYRIHYGTSSGNYTDVEDVGDVNTYGLPNLNITSSDPYYFVVAAYTSIGEEGFFSNEAVLEFLPPSNLTISNLTHSDSQYHIILTWDASMHPAVDHYKVYWGNSQGGPYDGSQSPVASGDTISLDEGFVYYLAVKAVDGDDNESATFSNEVRFQPITTDEDTPVNITLVGSDAYDSVVDTGPSHGQLSSDIEPIPTYTPDKDYNGPDSFTFRVNDGETHVFTGIVSIDVTAVNDPPTIIGTLATSVNEDAVYSFTLDAGDIDVGDTLTFSIENKPSWASFDTNTGTLTGTPGNDDVGTTMGIVITVTDGSASISLPAFDIEVVNVNDAPTAGAGPDQTVDEGVTVTLDGSNSTDVDDGIASYFWEQTGGNPVSLSDLAAVQPTFTTPDVGADGASLTFQLTVTDNGGLQSSDSCIVNVTWDNDPPTADAGPDQTVDEGVTVTLDGSNSTDVDDGIASYLWEQTGGNPVSLSDPTAVQPTFTTPDVGADGESLTFQLTVTDNGGLQSTDTCIVNVTWDNDPPIADAGPDQTVDEGVTVTLDGSNSTDADDGIHHYLWTQTVGTPVTLSDATAVQPTFVTPPVDSNGTHLEFLLVVTDNGKLQHTGAVSIDVKDNGIIGFPSDVLTTETSTMKTIGIKVESGGNTVSFMTVDPASLHDTTNIPDDLIYGLIDMQLKPDIVGGTVRVTIYQENSAPDGYVWCKYGPNNGWYDYSDYAEFNADRDQVTLTLVDGGIGDDDGVANGIIVDPSGLGSGVKGIALGGGGSGCFIATAAFGSNMDRHVRILSEFRDNRLLTSPAGHRMADLYYKFSPPAAYFLRQHPAARVVVRYSLTPLTGVAYLALYIHPVALLFGFILLVLTGVYCGRRFSQSRINFSQP